MEERREMEEKRESERASEREMSDTEVEGKMLLQGVRALLRTNSRGTQLAR